MSPKAYQRITSYLRKLYGETLFTRDDMMHPLIVFPPYENQIYDVDSVLGSPPARRTHPDDLAIYDHGYLQNLQNTKSKLFNGVTFDFQSLRPSPLQIRATLGNYFDMLATCGALERELREVDITSTIQLPLRSQLHRKISAQESLYNGKGRSAAIGVATLIIYRKQGEYRLLLAKRSQETATDAGFFHVLPAFIFQPSDSDFQHPQEWSVEHQIYREYLEELYDSTEIHQPDRHDYFYEHPALQFLKGLMAQNQAQLLFTGVVANLLTLRMEICTLLLIHAEEWVEQLSDPTSGLSLNTSSETIDDSLLTAPIANDEALLSALPEHAYLKMPPQAWGALWLGVEQARREIESR